MKARLLALPIIIALVAATGAVLVPAQANQSVAVSGGSTAGIDFSSPSSMRNAYRIHQRKRNLHAAHLNRLWEEERNLSNERDVRGRAGDMASVQEIEQELYSVRTEIDQRRAALSYENRILALIDERLGGR